MKEFIEYIAKKLVVPKVAFPGTSTQPEGGTAATLQEELSEPKAGLVSSLAPTVPTVG